MLFEQTFRDLNAFQENIIFSAEIADDWLGPVYFSGEI